MKKKNTTFNFVRLLIFFSLIFGAFVSAFAQDMACAAADYDCQIKVASKAIQADSQDSESFYARANAYLNKGDYQSAIRDYTKTLELNEDKYEVYDYRASAYYHLKKYDAAISDYTKSIELDPTYAESYINRGNAYDDAGNYDAAMKDYGKAIKLEPEKANAYYNRGIAALNHGNNKQAISDLQKTLQLKPDNADARELLGKAQAGKQEKDAQTKEKWANFGKALDRIADAADTQSSRQTSTDSNERTTVSGNTSNSSGSSNISSGSGLPAGSYACFATVNIYAGRGGSGAYSYPIYNSSRQTRGAIRVQSDGTYRLDDGTVLHYSFSGGAIRWLDGTFAEASSSNLQNDDQGKPQILIKFNGDKDVWDCTKQ